MKTYHVTLTIDDCTSVDAETPEEAMQVASDIFYENGYRDFELDVCEEVDYE